MFGKLFLHKPLRFYLELCGGLLAIIASIIFFALDRQVLGGNIRFDDSSYITLIFLIAGGALSIVDAFFPLPFLGIVTAILFGLGLGSHLRLACFPLADVTNPAPFFTGDKIVAGNATTLFFTFLILFAILALFIVIANFLPAKKKQQN